jgi:hypothetical protein
MGALPNVYPAYQPVTSEEAREKFAKAWGATTEAKVGLTVTEMMPGILEGKINALYILGEDPVMSDPDTNHIRHCLKVDFLVLQEIFPSETAAMRMCYCPVRLCREDGHVHQHRTPRADGASSHRAARRFETRLVDPSRNWRKSLMDRISDRVQKDAPHAAGITRSTSDNHVRDQRRHPILWRHHARAAGSGRTPAMALPDSGSSRHADLAYQAIHARQGQVHARSTMCRPRNAPTMSTRW